VASGWDGGAHVGITVDRDRCIGSGACVFAAPDVFDLDDGGFAVVRPDARADEAGLLMAVDGCPTGALALTKSSVS
jgi:ferredoxin